MPGSYIPAQDALFLAWLDNFDDITSVDFATLGLSAGQATDITTVRTDFDAAYALATNPATRTPVTVAAKDTSRATAEAVVRPLAQFIRNNPDVSDGDKIALGLTVPDVDPTPIPPPTTFPLLDMLNATPGVHKMQYRDSDTPTTKAKPYGAMQMELYRAIGTVAAPDPTTAVFVGLVTKSPTMIDQNPDDAGKIATYFGRWVTRTGLTGPWSSGVSLTVAF